MNTLTMIGEITSAPKEIYNNQKGIALYRMEFKTTINDSNNYSIVSAKIWQSLLSKVDVLEEGDLISLTGKIQSFGDVEKNNIVNDIIISSLFLIN